MQWEPIDTAPKDGTPIWCYLDEFDEQAVLRWVKCEEWAGWRYLDSLLNDVLDCELAPTHWMPLPSRPAT